MRGQWQGVREFNPWKRVFLVLVILFTILVTSIVVAQGAHAASGCSSRSKTYRYKVAGITVMWYRATAQGCWNAKNTAVTSFSMGVTGDATIPYRYEGIIGTEPVGGKGQHMWGKMITVRFDSCVPPFGCTSTWQPYARFVLDSYGNWDLRPYA
jgi:hypothetical protein